MSNLVLPTPKYPPYLFWTRHPTSYLVGSLSKRDTNILLFLFIVVARDQSDNSNNTTAETEDPIATFLDEERLREEHRRIARKIHSFDNFHETCSEVNLSSRPSKNGKSYVHTHQKYKRFMLDEMSYSMCYLFPPIIKKPGLY